MAGIIVELKFFLFFDGVKHYECRLPHPLTEFEMLMSPDMEYPVNHYQISIQFVDLLKFLIHRLVQLLCVGVRRGYASDVRLNVVRLTATEAFLDDGSVAEDVDGQFFLKFRKKIIGTNGKFKFFFFRWWEKGLATVLPHREAMDVVCVTPVDKEAILVAHDSVVQVVDMHGQATKTPSMKSSAPIKFSFRIEAVGKKKISKKNKCCFQ